MKTILRSLLILMSATTVADAAGPASPLIGSWRLVSYEGHTADGKITLDYGSSPEGRLMYDQGGRMSVHLVDPGRRVFASGDFLHATPDELREAFYGYFGYYGRYTVDEKSGVVTHHVEGAAFPNYIGTEQRRLFKIEGDRLILRTPPERAAGSDVSYTIVWQRLR